jgi:transketolase
MTRERATDLETDLDRIAINTIRFLAVDMVEAANSGHPGTPMAQAPLAYLLWSRYLRHHPGNPDWPNRDRFVLSCGHASALLYSLLHLSGYDLPLDELRRFRQLGSKTPGHPEVHHTPGVETTTGPLGQGVGNAVGMAMAERLLASRFNREGFPVIDHRVWCIASDGDLMEGVSSEASSLAAHHRLDKLTVFWDDNHITIDGETSLAFSEDVVARYAAYGWHVQRVDDANDLGALAAAIDAAVAETRRPSFIAFRSHIGFGAPHKQDTASAHGEPLGAEEAAAAKKALGWPVEPAFHVPPEAPRAFAAARERGREAERLWSRLFERYAETHPELAESFRRARAGELPEGWQEALPRFRPEDGAQATRKTSGQVINALADRLPLLVGGSADLTPSNKTDVKDGGIFSADDPRGRNLHFGIREHAMGAVLNGMALSGLLRPYGGTFLIFSDYMRPAIRLAAMMELPVLYVFTHDSIFLGEDGPTHQPVSQLLSLRSIPNLTVLRPADANETAQAWRVALENRRGPTALALTRQGLPILAQTAERAEEGVARGAYVLSEAGGAPQALLLASGSEVWVAEKAQEQLAADGIATRVVSMPSWELFAQQPREYRESVLPPSVTKRLAVEAATTLGWDRWVGSEGEVLGIDHFGSSAPWKDLQKQFGFTPEAVAERVRRMLG